VKLVGDAIALHNAEEIIANNSFGERPQQRQVVSADKVVFRLHYERWNSNVVPHLGVLSNQHVTNSEAEASNFVSRRARAHERHAVPDSVVLVDIYVVTETNRLLFFLAVLVNISAAFRRRRTSQCAGTSPSHGTPESFITG
jgi:hypothetical protein